MKPRFKRLGGKVKERTFIAWDIETYVDPSPKKGEFMFGGVYDGRQYIYFKDRERLKSFLTRSCFGGVTFVAHNAEYDINRTFLDDPHLERFYMGSRLIYARYPVANGYRTLDSGKRVSQRKYIYFWDTWNLASVSLERIGELFNYKKLKIEFQNRITQKYIGYNERDCKITYKFAVRYQEIVNGFGGNMKSTIAGCAMDIFRRNYLAEDFEFWKPPKDILMNFRSAYYGGRTEVFNMNEFNNVYYYDINSSYPAAMHSKPLPVLDTWQNGVNLDKEGCSYVEVKVKDTQYPVLPFRGEKVLFPVGTWRGWYYNNELRYAVENGDVLRPIRGYHFHKSYPVFNEYVVALYSARRATPDKVENWVYKYLMNSLYGRFAMRSRLDLFTGKKVKRIFSDSPSSNVIWSGYITAYGRIALHKLIVKSDSIYCDTDSTMTLKKLKGTSKKLGGFSLEKEWYSFRAFAPKHYQYQEKKGDKKKQKLKGVPDRAIKLAENHYRFERPMKYKGFLKNKQGHKLSDWISVDKRLSMVYDKRIINKDGTTRPHTIVEEM